jgi:hypothetical protein
VTSAETSNDLTVRQFLETQPLYSRTRVQLPELASDLAPNSILMYCEVCKAERPFRDSRARGLGLRSGPPPKVEDREIYFMYYKCAGCEVATFQCWVQAFTGPSSGLRKVGQCPPWDISIPSGVHDALGASVDVYKRAKICLSQGFGLAACAYMRRVLEDQVTPILNLIHQNAVEAGEDAVVLDQIRSAMKGKAADEKLSIVYRHAPASLIVDGKNPLKLMHDLLSQGLHSLSEEECIQIALQIAAALEFTIVELRRHRDARQKFAEAIKATSMGTTIRKSEA